MNELINPSEMAQEIRRRLRRHETPLVLNRRTRDQLSTEETIVLAGMSAEEGYVPDYDERTDVLTLRQRVQ